MFRTTLWIVLLERISVQGPAFFWRFDGMHEDRVLHGTPMTNSMTKETHTMRSGALLVFAVLFFAAGVSMSAQTMTITRGAARTPQQGSSDFFTGTVRVTPLFDANNTLRASCASVSFDAGARSA